jgi:ABC-type lipoprotein export system ATPase subunit
VIMADEPTGNLDTATSFEVMAILQGLVAQGKTVILVTHESDIAAYAQRVITLRDGQIIDDKTQTPLAPPGPEVAA